MLFALFKLSLVKKYASFGLVTRKQKTRNCPCEKRGFKKSTHIRSIVYPCALFIAIAKTTFTEN